MLPQYHIANPCKPQESLAALEDRHAAEICPPLLTSPRCGPATRRRNILHPLWETTAIFQDDAAKSIFQDLHGVDMLSPASPSALLMSAVTIEA